MDFIQNEIKEIKKLLLALNIQQKEILTIEDASQYLGLSTSRLYKMTSNKEIPHYKPGGKKIYLKRLEIDQWITNSRVSTDDDCALDMDNYLSKPLEN
ncbi:DNA-binding protein [Flavobacterium arcticum]|uniref:DNA-binding protein n=1 Tax=Flavobacterium arcticum TaxID=1784713 RepID=A0A345HAA4_9FLAO|nr:helix-turn-helix domain-containing protein [Flavobacterium arcticum]AXG73514.1 DNA-binding protein [Flavobacterium arcticum]KAF2513304.1 helix-turn-helix domain-containing protein [Flavobacterium arcticum]